MIATIINATAVAIGGLLGNLLRNRISPRFTSPIYTAAGIISLSIGLSMSVQSTRFLYLALSLVLGGIVGHWLGIEEMILRVGKLLRRLLLHSEADASTATDPSEPHLQEAPNSERQFATGFLNASILFTVGALTIIGTFEAGVRQNYQLLLAKSVLDGAMAVVLAAVMGLGVACAALTILLYQGSLTLLAVWIRPYVSELLLGELSAVGGAMVIMIGINLLQLKKIQTANYLPALVLVSLLAFLDRYLPWLH